MVLNNGNVDTMETRIRDMKVSDISSVLKLAANASELYSADNKRWYPRQAFKKWLNSKNDDILLVSESDNKVIGCCLCYVHYRGWAVIDSIIVDPKFRRRGVAKMLMNEAISRMKRLGIAYVQGIVQTTNKKMLRLSKGLGFNRGYKFYVVDMVLRNSKQG